MKKSTKRVEYQGYYYNLAHIIEILILGLLCRLQTMKDIHYWTQSRPVQKMLKEEFGIEKIPCYSHFTNLVGIIDSNELNKIIYGIFPKISKNAFGKNSIY